MPTPDPHFVASVPLQYSFFDKTTGDPLASGIVTFYKDPQFTIKKSVYQLSNDPQGDIVFTALPNPLILSGIGTFVDPGGDNLVPYYFPYSGTPGSADPGDLELYFVTVENSDLVLQFTLLDWPPNALSGATGNAEATSLNVITNPQFSVVSFTENPTTGTKIYTVSGTDTRNPLAPGWELVTSGAGTVTVSQQSISENIPTEAPFSLEIESSAGVTQVAIVQRITNDPRLLSNPTSVTDLSYISGFVTARSAISTTAVITMSYFPSNGVITQIFSANTESDNTFISMSGTAAIETPLSTDGSSGYVDVIIDISPQTSVEITSIQLVSVADATDVAAYIQQSTQQQLNGMMWYYQPKLAAMPIPSYTIGWDFPFNPCQELGTAVAASGLGNNLSRYIADQTIAFEAVGNVLSYGFNAISGLTALATGSATQFAIIQYLDATTAVELLQGNMAVNINPAYGYPNALTGYINLYYTNDASLPVITAGTNQSLVATMVDGQPATFNGNWTKVPRSGLGDAAFNPALGFAQMPFSGWNAVGLAGATTATYFAIVISFTAMAAATAMSIRSCTLCKGDIATPPPATNKEETLAALEYYYERSYELGTAAGTASTTINQVCFPMSSVTYTTNTGPVTYNWYASAANFTVPLKTVKRTSGYTPVLYATGSGAANNVSFQYYNPGANAPTNLAASTWSLIAGTNNFNGTLAATTNLQSLTGLTTATPALSSSIAFQYVVDARFGVV